MLAILITMYVLWWPAWVAGAGAFALAVVIARTGETSTDHTRHRGRYRP